MCTRSGMRSSAARTRSGSGITLRKSPPAAKSRSSSPRPAASIISGAVLPGAAGTSNPHLRPRFSAFSSFTGSPPGNEVA